jgi:hypothetical protein
MSLVVYQFISRLFEPEPQALINTINMPLAILPFTLIAKHKNAWQISNF